jgi:tripartite-type tricarboxylate transporter receptor subunit TctC
MRFHVDPRNITVTLAATLAICVGAMPSQAQNSGAAFYKGKTVQFIVGFGPGGGYDTYARMIAPDLSRALGATVVVENQPGAGGITALDNLVAAPPDGLQIMHLNGAAAALSQVVGLSGVRYDLAKLSYLATVSGSSFVWLVGPKSSIKSPQDAINAHKQITWAAAGAVDVLAAGAAFTCKALALDCRIVPGYPGSDEAALAVSRGEMDAMFVTDTSANNYVRSGEARPLVTISRKRSPFFPNTPTIFEVLKLNTSQEFLFDYYATMGNLSRILVAPPNLPSARLAYLDASVKKALTDPALIAQGQRTQFYIDYLDADSTREEALKVVESTTPEQRQLVNAALSAIKR